jgi:hypothetical protein
MALDDCGLFSVWCHGRSTRGFFSRNHVGGCHFFHSGPCNRRYTREHLQIAQCEETALSRAAVQKLDMPPSVSRAYTSFIVVQPYSGSLIATG